ncbi:ATP-dependent Clp protease ATP-binding subunit [Fumia xinanensis]|uniref:ATP-dependent Clp protease ATP-binding subunit n=1 Tax=Fumia xinanensis TaxID=2763659 RepID=A0A926E398_9FIRM|nr:ATP-dependent Clp protease ATP-binding subunit [Fumia xinanensis]MBC8560247.1 ATP-dependent Clp protease ATP-binding subunit [Fumia xinanensis]
MLCCKCKKRPAMLFVAKFDGKDMVNEGYCLKCASELGLPQVKSMMDSMGITQEDLDNFDEQLDNLDNDMFELGGAETMPPFIQKMFGNITPKDGAGEEEENFDDSALPVEIPDEEPRTSRTQNKKESRKDRQKRKYLDNFCTNLNEKAKEHKMDRIVGRDAEIYRVEQILSRRQKNNPCLIGEPGVGKTAIAEGIAQKIVSGDVPFRLLDKEVYLLDLTALVAGTQFRGQFESRVKGLIDEVKAKGNVILFIDEVHTLVGTGDSEGSMSAANIMKPALSRGEIQVIGATTFGEYRKHIEKDSALERRFQPVKIEEPTIAQTIEVLKGIREYYQNHHKVLIPDEIVNACANLSERYITDRFLPDKAIDLLDESAACASIKSTVLTDCEKLNKRLKGLYDTEAELEAVTENPDYEAIARTKGEIIMVKEQLKELEPKVKDVKVTMEDVAKVIELWTGIPAEKVSRNEGEKLQELEDELKAKIIGQDEAIEAVVKAIRRSKVRLNVKKRPASFIFVGPTGVGKTELVKVLAEGLFDKVDPLIRVDMSEYMEKHTVSRLVGSPPGYVGFDEAGQLTEKVRRRPYSVVLFDEIEKAHPDVMNILLQILDEGRITDAQGRTVNFENTVVVMTSNAGSNDKSGVVGFNKDAKAVTKEKAMKGLSSFLRPEFMARVDEIVVFNPLSRDNLKDIAKLMLEEMRKPLEDLGLGLQYDEKALEVLADKSQNGKFAARDLRSTIRREVEDKISMLVISTMKNKKEIFVSADEKDIIVSMI